MVELKNLGISTMDKIFYNDEEAKKLQEARKKSILTREQVKEKLKSGELKVINPEAEFKTAVYVCQEKGSELFKVQFYDSNGELLATYPWNGSIYEKELMLLPRWVSGVEDLQLTTTPKGKIVFREHYYPDGPYRPLLWRGNVFYDGAMYGDGHRGAVNFNGYQHEVLPEESRRQRDEKWFKHMEEHGDDYIEHCSNHNYVI